MAFPGLKTKKVEYSSPKSSQFNNRSPKKIDSIFNIQDGVQILETLELTKYSKQIEVNLPTHILKEISKLEKELDTNEINIYRSTMNTEQEYKIYRNYLEKAILIISQKNSRIYAFLMRGVTGYDKIIKKLNTKMRSDIQRNSVNCIKNYHRDINTQTITSEITEESVPACLTPEMDNVMSLPSSIAKIKLSRISNQLADIFESLNSLYAEIPAVVEPPEPHMEEYVETDTKKIINLKLTIIRENITKILQNSAVHKLEAHKETQTDFINRRSIAAALEDMNGEKELDLFKITSKYNIVTREKAALEESLAKLNIMLEEIEKKNNSNEIELTHLRHSQVANEDKIRRHEDRINFLNFKLEAAGEKNIHLKKVINSLKILLKKKQNQLQESLDHLFNTQLI